MLKTVRVGHFLDETTCGLDLVQGTIAKQEVRVVNDDQFRFTRREPHDRVVISALDVIRGMERAPVRVKSLSARCVGGICSVASTYTIGKVSPPSPRPLG